MKAFWTALIVVASISVAQAKCRVFLTSDNSLVSPVLEETLRDRDIIVTRDKSKARYELALIPTKGAHVLNFNGGEYHYTMVYQPTLGNRETGKTLQFGVPLYYAEVAPEISHWEQVPGAIRARTSNLVAEAAMYLPGCQKGSLD